MNFRAILSLDGGEYKRPAAAPRRSAKTGVPIPPFKGLAEIARGACTRKEQDRKDSHYNGAAAVNPGSICLPKILIRKAQGSWHGSCTKLVPA
jgi:hypothetical protein